MSNRLKINWQNGGLELLLLNEIKVQDQSIKNYVLECISSNVLGKYAFNKECALWVLENQSQQTERYERMNLVSSYYESLIVQADSLITQEIYNQLTTLEQEIVKYNFVDQIKEGTSIWQIGDNSIPISQNVFISEICEDTGLFTRMKRMIQRMLTVCSKYLIDERVVNTELSQYPWIKNFFEQQLGKILIIQDETSIIPTTMNDLKTKEDNRLVFKYKNKEFILLEQIDLCKIQTNEIIFELSFALEHSMDICVIEDWKTRGMKYTKEIIRQKFYHPIFYTGDKMKLMVEKNKSKYVFKLTHMETGREISF